MQVQAAAAGSGWSQVPEEALKALPGPHFERKQHDAGDDAQSSPSPLLAAGMQADYHVMPRLSCRQRFTTDADGSSCGLLLLISLSQEAKLCIAK